MGVEIKTSSPQCKKTLVLCALSKRVLGRVERVVLHSHQFRMAGVTCREQKKRGGS